MKKKQNLYFNKKQDLFIKTDNWKRTCTNLQHQKFKTCMVKIKLGDQINDHLTNVVDGNSHRISLPVFSSHFSF